VDLIDDYRLVGASPGQSLPCQAILFVTGLVRAQADLWIELGDESNPTGSVAWSTSTPGASQSGQVVLPLTLVEGQPLRLRATVRADATNLDGALTSADAVLRFAGLPRGVSVTSCRAYDLPVPAATATWGRLKATYR
jgi:hypothetical protein